MPLVKGDSIQVLLRLLCCIQSTHVNLFGLLVGLGFVHLGPLRICLLVLDDLDFGNLTFLLHALVIAWCHRGSRLGL